MTGIFVVTYVVNDPPAPLQIDGEGDVKDAEVDGGPPAPK
jgi:hypothetical protein